MDEIAFQKAVVAASLALAALPYFELTPQEAHARALEATYPTMRELVSELIPRSHRERWAFDTLNVLAQRLLRYPSPTEPMLQGLADWVADVLEGMRERPAKGEKRFANRDVQMAETVFFLMQTFNLKATRSGAGPAECCAEGGSACDAVGAVLDMPYKTVEGIWRSWSGLITRQIPPSPACSESPDPLVDDVLDEARYIGDPVRAHRSTDG